MPKAREGGGGLERGDYSPSRKGFFFWGGGSPPEKNFEF